MEKSKTEIDDLIERITTTNEGMHDSEVTRANTNESDERMSDFFASFGFLPGTSSVGLIITYSDGRIVSVNKAVKDLLGITDDEAKKLNITDLYANPEDRRYLLSMLAASKTVSDFEVEVRDKSGILHTVLANIDFIELDHTNMLLTALCDITQYKKSQEIRFATDKEYKELFSHAPIGISVTDFQGDLIISNNAFRELLGYADEDVFLNVGDLYYIPTDRRKLLKLTKSLGNVRDFETVFINKNSEMVNVLINTDIIEFNGRKDMLLTSIRDVSKLKRTEDELIQERDFSNTILNIAAMLVIVVNRNGAVSRFNRACEELTGYSAGEIIGTKPWNKDFFDPVLSEDEFSTLLGTDHPDSYENVMISKNGERHNISWTFSAIFDAEKHAQFIIATGLDITDWKRAEDELYKANNALASWVRELQERTEEMRLMNEMGEHLQSCQTVEEACAISAQYVQRICPASRGALYLIGETKDFAEAAEVWGEPVMTKEVFVPLSCWAIRRGRLHLVDENHSGLLCGHVTGPKKGQYLCAPLLVNGEVIGILHLNHVNIPGHLAPEPPGLSYTDHKAQIITTVAEHIALAISNLRLKETLRQQSIRDALTGLYNRRYMEETLERELRRAVREHKPVCLIMMDIDFFKEFNDRAGHGAGDALLRELGAFLRNSTRGGDVACRYGGEEFLMVLPDANLEDGGRRAEEIRRGVKELKVDYLGKTLEQCSVSLGVAVFPEHGETMETFLKAADSALYKAKNDGRDRVALA